MTIEEVTKYIIPACENLRMPDYSRLGFVTIGDANMLDELLGITEYGNWWERREQPLSVEIRELYRKLAGPYGTVVLKAWRIQKGLEA